MSTETTEQRLTEALAADGFNPPPAVGQRWLDVEWQNLTGRDHHVEIEAIWRNGLGEWVAHAKRCTPDGRPLGWPGSQVESLEALMSEYRLMDIEED